MQSLKRKQGIFQVLVKKTRMEQVRKELAILAGIELRNKTRFGKETK